jgi:hypothetical protein
MNLRVLKDVLEDAAISTVNKLSDFTCDCAMHGVTDLVALDLSINSDIFQAIVLCAIFIIALRKQAYTEQPLKRTVFNVVALPSVPRIYFVPCSTSNRRAPPVPSAIAKNVSRETFLAMALGTTLYCRKTRQ